MRVVLTLLGLSGAISASSALFPVVAQDFEDPDWFDPLDPIELAVDSDVDAQSITAAPLDSNVSVQGDLDPDSSDDSSVSATLTPDEVKEPVDPTPVAVLPLSLIHI